MPGTIACLAVITGACAWKCTCLCGMYVCMNYSVNFLSCLLIVKGRDVNAESYVTWRIPVKSNAELAGNICKSVNDYRQCIPGEMLRCWKFPGIYHCKHMHQPRTHTQTRVHAHIHMHKHTHTHTRIRTPDACCSAYVSRAQKVWLDNFGVDPLAEAKCTPAPAPCTVKVPISSAAVVRLYFMYSAAMVRPHVMDRWYTKIS